MADDRSARKRPPKLVAVDQQTFALTLTHHGDGQDVAQTIHATPAESRLGPETVAPITLKRLGYDLKEELGRGGLGSVHLAQQQAFDRAVAIKRLLVQGDRMAAMKFYAEAVATAALEHPNIVPVHDLLSDQQGRLQLVMKRVEGRTWKHLLHPTKAEAAETLTLDDHLDILVKVVEAVSFAHDKGFLHRDLKPDNVMVGAHGEVLVMDWGCAVAFGDHHQHPIVPRVEEIDQITGTPAYMAPEMVLIEQHATGPHSDVYLLGGLLYEVLTGVRPHAGASVMAVLRAAAMDDVVPPHQRAPDRQIPTELADICMNALVREPGERIATASEFHHRLLSYRRHAEAMTLAGLAERLLIETGPTGKEADRQARVDDRLRRAVAAAENACQLWPGWAAGHALAARANLTHARHCLSTGGMTQAESLAQRALPHAREAGDERAATQAKALAEQARRLKQSGQQRERALVIMRRAAIGMGFVIMVGALVAVAIINSKRHEAEVQRHEAEAERQRADEALAAFTLSDAQRKADQRRFAPGLLAQAKAAITGGQLDAALPFLQGAVEFDPELTDAVALQANVLAALGRYDEALPVARQWQQARPDDENARDLIGLCALAKTQDQDVVAARCAELFQRQLLPTLAEKGLKTNPERLLAYQARIRQIAPDAAGDLQINDAGILSFAYGKGLLGHPELIDLSALRGMPFHDLNLSDTGVADLSPLAGMPLESLQVRNTKVRDLSPLRNCPLTSIDVSNCPLDITTLSGFRLKSLAAWNIPQLRSLDVLRGMPLELLNMGGSSIADLSPLTDMPLGVLWIDGSFADLKPLAHCPLTSLSLVSTATLDFTATPFTEVEHLRIAAAVSPASNLGRMHPATVTIYGYNAQSDLSWINRLDGSQLQEVVIWNCNGVSLVPLATLKFTTLTVSYTAKLDFSPLQNTDITALKISFSMVDWTSLLALKANPHLRTIVVADGVETPVAEFWKHFDPAFPPLSPSNQPSLDARPALPADHPQTTAPGLAYEACTGTWNPLTDLAHAAMIKAGVTAVPVVDLLTQKDNAGLRFTGYIEVPSDGIYRFALTAEDNARLTIGGQVVIDNQARDFAVRMDGLIRLLAGKHTLSLLYAKGAGAAALGLAVQAPQSLMIPVPATWYSHDASP